MAWILTLNTSNDAVLRKDDPFDSYKSIFSYLTEFFGKFEKKLPLFEWGNFETAIKNWEFYQKICHNSGCI